MAQPRIVVYISAQEKEWIELQAGDVPLTRWCHRLLFENMKIEVGNAGRDQGVGGAKGLPRGEGVVASGGRKSDAVRVPRGAGAVCEHGKAKGYNCGLCGGLAKVGI